MDSTNKQLMKNEKDLDKVSLLILNCLLCYYTILYFSLFSAVLFLTEISGAGAENLSASNPL